MLTACSVDTETQDATHSPPVSKLRINQTVSSYTVERMFIENDQDEIIERTTERQYDDLVEVGALIDDGEHYTFEPDPNSWTAANLLGEPGVPISRVHNAIQAILFANNVTWCGGETRGTEFVYEYVEEFEGKFDTYEEYEQSIADYVDCGTGE
jgi:hypothetical protein